MDWTDLHSFITVTREKSISKASQLLYISQPTLTARLKKLEQELGVDLLERNWKGVNLTKHGATFLSHALKAVQEIDDVISINQLNTLYLEPLADHHKTLKDPYEKLKIGIARPLGVSFFSPVMLELNRSFTDLKYDVFSDPPNYILDLVSIGEMHLGIVPHTYMRPDLESISIFSEEMLLLGPKKMDIPLEEDFNNADQLLKKTFILFNSRISLKKLTELSVIQLLGGKPEDIREVNDLGIVLNMISSGLGYTILPNSFICDTMRFFSTLHSSGPLPRRLQHDSIPYQIYRLGKQYPARRIQMIYSPTSQFHLPIKDIAVRLAAPYIQLSDALAP
jgi:DNA-binding transcriptional LysR family regulator